MIGAGSVATKDIPPYSLVVGNPGKIVGMVDKYGNKVHWMESNSIYSKIFNMYDIIVIGAGIVGLSTAFELIQNNPNKKILIIEKEKVWYASNWK